MMWKLKIWYRKWNQNPIHNIVHWALFFAMGILIANHLVLAISTTSIGGDAINDHAKDVEALLQD